MKTLGPTILVVLALFTLVAAALIQRIPPDVEVETVPHQLNPSPADAEPTSFAYVVPTTTTTTEAPTTTSTAPRRRLTKSGATYPTDELLYRLAMCETGGTMNQRAVSRSGRYLSYFQWSIGTWWSVGGEGDPRDHPYEVQRELARTLILQAGWSQFPHCSRVIGAR